MPASFCLLARHCVFSLDLHGISRMGSSLCFPSSYLCWLQRRFCCFPLLFPTLPLLLLLLFSFQLMLAPQTYIAFFIFLLCRVFENLNVVFRAVVCDLELFEVRGPTLGLSGEPDLTNTHPTQRSFPRHKCWSKQASQGSRPRPLPFGGGVPSVLDHENIPMRIIKIVLYFKYVYLTSEHFLHKSKTV